MERPGPEDTWPEQGRVVAAPCCARKTRIQKSAAALN